MMAYINLPDSAKLAPGQPAPCTVWRWHHHGTTVPGSKTTIRLNYIRVGWRCCNLPFCRGLRPCVPSLPESASDVKR